MMVVHEENERPVEVAIIRKPLLEDKSYVIVKNHVRELELKTSAQNSIGDKSTQTLENERTKKKNKSDRKYKDTEEMPTTSNASSVKNTTSEIDASDLEELRSVYTKCKEVISKIEIKYGHLLGLEDETITNSKSLKRKIQLDTSEDECHCKRNKKIVFDDEGRQIAVDHVPEKHICVKKAKILTSDTPTSSGNVAVEYQDTEIELPDNIQELTALLHDPHLEKTLRNKVLDKIRTLKQEYINEIRFNRHILIEKLKSDPDGMLDFKGTNLSTIPGYPDS